MLLRVALFTTLFASTALGQNGTFDIQSGGRSIGRSTYSLSKAKQGYKLSSHATTHFGGSESELTNEFKYTDSLAYTEGFSSNIVSQLHTSYTPNKTRDQLTIAMVQAGVQDQHNLVIKPDFTIMPAYDAGAAQVMLLLATTHPSEKNLYNIVVPGSTRSGPVDPADQVAGPKASPGNNAYDALWATGPEAAGTLDGKPVALHTYVLTAGKFTWIFYADEAGTLMQVNVSMVNASYIRAKFKLTPAP